VIWYIGILYVKGRAMEIRNEPWPVNVEGTQLLGLKAYTGIRRAMR